MPKRDISHPLARTLNVRALAAPAGAAGAGADRFDPVIRFFWEGAWKRGMVESRRRIYTCELVYVSKGRFTLVLGDRAHVVGPGALAVIPPGYWHESRADRAPVVVRHCVHFVWTPEQAGSAPPIQSWEGEAFDAGKVLPAPPTIAGLLPVVVKASKLEPVRILVEEMFRRLRNMDTAADLMLWPILRHLVAQASPRTGLPAGMGKSMRSVFAARQYMDSHYTEALLYPDLCKVTGLSKSHLCTIFRRSVGRTPMAYLAALRLGHARRLLCESGMNVNEVARAVGIPDANYFARLFRERFGDSPSAFLAGQYSGGTFAGRKSQESIRKPIGVMIARSR